MTYRIDLGTPSVTTPCTFAPSAAAPGKTLCINEDGSSMVVEPDGSQVRNIPAGDPNWDSPWTQGTVYGDLIVFRSANTNTLGVPRTYKMVV